MAEPKGEAAKPEVGKAGKYLHELKCLKIQRFFFL